jgi:4,4'-diaponeurosporenoate glycosyltransferase
MAMGSGNFTSLVGTKQKRLFGQLLLIERETFFKINGYCEVKSQILENYFLSQKLIEKEIPFTSVLGKSSISFRMFPEGYKSLKEGWTNAFSRGATQSSQVLLFLIILWSAAAMLSFTWLLSSVLNGHAQHLMISFTLYVLYSLQLYLFSRKITNFPMWVSLVFPYYFIFFLIIFMQSSRINKTGASATWKGRTIINK